VTDVRGVEGSAEDAEAQRGSYSRTWPEPSITYL
jgi:hypothetical protein